jgi:predicted lactoylglutathione lyase
VPAAGDLKLPPPVPELPVGDIHAAAEAYELMGFTLDWVHEDSFAGLSKDAARIFLRRRNPHDARPASPVTIWLNMASPAEVDELHRAWRDRGVSLVEELRTTPYNLREFTAEDLDGNRWRVFYDLGGAGV